MQNAALSLRDEDELEDSLASERAGDRAREDGELLLALVHYRKAAELRAGDSALAAKIAETASARAAAEGPLAATKVSPNEAVRARRHGARLRHSRHARSRHHKPGKRLSARSKHHSRSHDGDEAKRRLSPLIET